MPTAVAIDFETANEQRTSACSIGLAWLERGRVVRTEHHYIRPAEMRFSTFNIQIHGISPDMVAHAPRFGEVWEELAPRIDGRFVIAHNAAFDLGVLRHCLDEAGHGYPTLRYGCTVAVAKKVWPELASHRLNAMAHQLELALQHHRADSDAAACAGILAAACRVMQASTTEELFDLTGLRPGRLFPGGYEACSGAPRRRRREDALA